MIVIWNVKFHSQPKKLSHEAGANLYFSLDNEPDLWSSTHAEIHPANVTYAELAQKNVDYAKAIKNVMPAAKVSGPVNYGFNGFENLQNAPDAASSSSSLMSDSGWLISSSFGISDAMTRI